jgi:N-acetylmuramoyl-L-alanine amidase
VEVEGGAQMNLKQLIFVNNACYKNNKQIVPTGIMVHSTGANNPNLCRYVGPDDGFLGQNKYLNHWNQDYPGMAKKCVHGFIGKLKDGTIATYQTLPWNHLGWHAGKGPNGSANSTCISFEICEDSQKDPMYFNAVYKEAVELCQCLCGLYSIKPERIIGHYEGWEQGIASNHGDPRYWFKKFGKSMDSFRADVKGGIAEVDLVGKIMRVQTSKDEGLSLWSTVLKDERIVRVPKGETVKVISDLSGWVLAEYKGSQGYADKQYLVLEPPEPIDHGALIDELDGIANRIKIITAALRG